MVQETALQFVERVPENLLSRVVGLLADRSLPGSLQSAVNETFADLADIDRDEAARAPASYETLNDLFTRELAPGAREVAPDPRRAVVPVDGVLSTFGAIEDGTLLQAKGKSYTVRDLLDSWNHAQSFRTGAYATFYLSPSKYHRIHSPVTGEIDEISYIPGHLFPVFPLAVERIDRLFAVNERVISFVDAAERGRVAVVKVGATCVGRITLTFHGLETNQSYRRRRVERLEPTERVANGDELGVFNLGSTVIVLIADEDFAFRGDLTRGDEVEMGEPFGEWTL